jgi:hypothetical protein
MGKYPHYKCGTGNPNEDVLEELELFQDVQKTEQQLAAGKTINHETAHEQILKPLNLFNK